MKEDATNSNEIKPQEICIDLPGESVQCWRSSDKIKVVLRKHRDVVFDVNIKKDAVYTVESLSEFYSPREKKLLRRVSFNDGEYFSIWVGREFKGELLLKMDKVVIGRYKVWELDNKRYGSDPKIKPEPFMVILGKKTSSLALNFSDNSLGIHGAQLLFKPSFDPKLMALKNLGSEFNYSYSSTQVDVKDYVAVTEALPKEIQPQVLKQLDSGVAVEGRVEEIFIAPKSKEDLSPLYNGIAVAAANIEETGGKASGQGAVEWGVGFITSNTFKETAGYIQENYKRLNKITMKVRIEKRVIGKYRVIFKGRPLIKQVGRGIGVGLAASSMHKSFKLGSEGSAFLDGGYGKSGRGGYGSVKRIMLTTAENFRDGMKIQIIGTVIDLVGDINEVYFTEKGSRDLTEFLGRAGVSLLKAGATAMLGSVIAAGIAIGVGAVSATVALPAFLVVGAVIGGYILAATFVDFLDEKLNIKSSAAEWAK